MISQLAQRLLLGAVRLYRSVVSPILPPRCRFEPTCSRYAEEAILICGPMRGSLKAVLRVLKCHPLHPGGFDPVKR